MKPLHEILKKLAGGDRRSIGRANEALLDMLNDPALFEVVFRGMLGGRASRKND